MLPNLSFDIQVEIIKKLPVKSLIQFRSVCKGWKLLIDSSHFIAGYNTPHHHMLIWYEAGYGEDSEVKYICFVDDDTFPQQRCALTVPPFLQDKVIFGNSHGLFCLTDYFRDDEDEDEDEVFSVMEMVVLWNPAIRKSIVIDVPNRVHTPFDSVLGFGVCPITKDPMLVKITYIQESWKMESISSIPCQVLIFTLSSGKWTTSSCNNLPPRRSIEFSYVQTNIGQFIYWLAYDWIAEDSKYRNLIMSFDMRTQEFREVDLPGRLAKLREPELFVSSLRESLVVVYCKNVRNRSNLWKGVGVVWIMEDGDSKAFTNLFTIKPLKASVWSTLGFRKSGEPIVEIIDDTKDFDTQHALVVCDPYSKNFKDLGICGLKHSIFGRSFTESLLLLDHDDGHIVRCEKMTLGTG